MSDKTWKCPECETIMVVCDKAGVEALEALSSKRDDLCRRLQQSFRMNLTNGISTVGWS